MTNIALVDSPVAGCPGSLVPPLPMDLGPGASYMGTCMAPGAMVTYTNFITATGDIVVENTAEASAGGVTVSDTVSDAIGFMDMDSAEVSVIDPTVVSMIGSQANATTWNTLLIITVIPALLIATVVAVRRRNWSN